MRLTHAIVISLSRSDAATMAMFNDTWDGCVEWYQTGAGLPGCHSSRSTYLGEDANWGLASTALPRLFRCSDRVLVEATLLFSYLTSSAVRCDDSPTNSTSD